MEISWLNRAHSFEGRLGLFKVDGPIGLLNRHDITKVSVISKTLGRAAVAVGLSYVAKGNTKLYPKS